MYCLHSLFLSMCLTWTATKAYYPMVFEEGGRCKHKLHTVTLPIADYDINNMYVDSYTTEKSFDLCLVPRTGPVTDRGKIWGIATYEAAQQIEENDKKTVEGKMVREDCERLTGEPHLVKEAEVDCELTIIHQNQNNSNVTQLTNIMPLAGTGQCPMRATSVVLAYVGGFDRERCEILKGTVKDTSCQFDLCFTEVVQCVPSDGWNPVQMCINKASSPIKCVITFEEGISNSKGSSTEMGGGVGVSYTASMSADLAGVFSASLSTSVSADFHWSNTMSDESTWSQTTKHTIEVKVPAGKTIQIQQLVGACGDLRVKTRNLQAIEQTSGRSRRIETRAYVPAL